MTNELSRTAPLTPEEVYSAFVNAEPRIVKDNPDGSQYVPISTVQEDLYELFFGQTKFELLRESFHKEDLSGVGRLHYLHPVSNEWLFQDGSASIPFQKGMRLDFPSLGSHILLNCAKKIGRRFGMFLNRDREDAPVIQNENNPIGDIPDDLKEKLPAGLKEKLNQK